MPNTSKKEHMTTNEQKIKEKIESAVREGHAIATALKKIQIHDNDVIVVKDDKLMRDLASTKILSKYKGVVIICTPDGVDKISPDDMKKLPQVSTLLAESEKRAVEGFVGSVTMIRTTSLKGIPFAIATAESLQEDLKKYLATNQPKKGSE